MFRSESRGFGCGIFVGGLIILGAFALLWFNEGRTNLGRVATESMLVSVEDLPALELDTFVAAQGRFSGDEPIGDPGLIRPGPYIAIERMAEMYAWEESSSSDNEDGPKEYTYSRVWTGKPEDSSQFEDSSEHRNPPMLYEPETIKVNGAKLGSYRVNMQELTLPKADNLVLTNDILRAGDDPQGVDRTVSENQLYIGNGTPQQPQIGDIRISYKVVPNNQQVTLFGAIVEGAISPYIHRDDSVLYRAFTSSREEAISIMKFEYRVLLWGLRAAGTFLIWLGMMITIGPITALLRYVPVLGRLGNRLIALVAFFGALVISTVFIFIAIIFHNPILLGLFILIVVGGGYWLWRNQQEEERRESARV